MNSQTMYRVRVADLNNEQLRADELAARVDTYATNRGQCDGITMDNADNLYLTDVENGAITVLDSSRNYVTLVSHPNRRWPERMSVGPDGYVYVTDNDIADITLQSKAHLRENAP